jgi:hypothetical protein
MISCMRMRCVLLCLRPDGIRKLYLNQTFTDNQEDLAVLSTLSIAWSGHEEAAVYVAYMRWKKLCWGCHAALFFTLTRALLWLRCRMNYQSSSPILKQFILSKIEKVFQFANNSFCLRPVSEADAEGLGTTIQFANRTPIDSPGMMMMMVVVGVVVVGAVSGNVGSRIFHGLSHHLIMN